MEEEEWVEKGGSSAELCALFFKNNLDSVSFWDFIKYTELGFMSHNGRVPISVQIVCLIYCIILELLLSSKRIGSGTSLVVQWLGICLPMQGTRVWALVWEVPACHRATKPVHHNYWSCALEPTSHNYWARVPQLLKPTRLEPVLCNKRSHRNEKPAHHNKE